ERVVPIGHRGARREAKANRADALRARGRRRSDDAGDDVVAAARILEAVGGERPRVRRDRVEIRREGELEVDGVFGHDLGLSLLRSVETTPGANEIVFVLEAEPRGRLHRGVLRVAWISGRVELSNFVADRVHGVERAAVAQP